MESYRINTERYMERFHSGSFYGIAGKINKSLGLIYEATLPGAAVGSRCRIRVFPDQGWVEAPEAEVVGFKDKKALLMTFDAITGINSESLVMLDSFSSTIHVSDALLGRVIDARGVPIDGKGPIQHRPGFDEFQSLYSKPSDPLKRARIDKPLDLGVRALNGLLTIGQGQRVGIMAGSGVGKSVLLGMLARNTSSDINVIGLIGERGREVREFIERDLGPEGLKRSVVVVATSDSSPLLRMRGAFVTTAVAEYFRNKGKSVLLMMDSVTRFCMAQREIGLAMGEPPASKGYPPSVFATLPRLLERAGTDETGGAITGIYTVLVEGDDMDEPIADATRSILDGHVVLSRKLAHRNHFPAIDVLQSTSRVMSAISDQSHLKWAGQLREWMALYNQTEDLINVGAYVKGANLKVDQAVSVIDRITAFLRQGVHEKSTFQDTLALMQGISRAGESVVNNLQNGQNPPLRR